MTRVRMPRVNGPFVQQYFLATCHINIHPVIHVETATSRLVHLCAQMPHRVLELSPTAPSQFFGYQIPNGQRHIAKVVELPEETCEAGAGGVPLSAQEADGASQSCCRAARPWC